jgi:uncharacterized protein
MKKWKLSKYTVILKRESGDALLHNSFMGAVALIPESKFSGIEAVITGEMTAEDLKNETLKELCENGFLFQSDVDEQAFVSDILDRENKSGNFDMIILPHENCNFRCNYCYESHKGGMIGADIVQGLKLFVDNKAKEIKGLSVRWFGGEPLLAKDIVYELSNSFIQSCARNNIPYWSHITTNAYLLTPQVVADLLRCKVNNFQVTFDGPETMHDSSRILAGGGKTFKKILNNLIKMKQVAADYAVSIRVNFNQESASQMDDFFGIMSESFGDDPRFGLYFRPIGKYGGPNDENIQVCEPSYGRLMEMELTDKYLQYGYLDKVIKKSLKSHGQVCYAGKESSIVVGADGTLYKCSVAFENPQNQVGNLLADGRLAIDQSRWDLWVNNQDAKHGKCVSCPVSPLCQGKYCPLYTIKEQKPVCPMHPADYAKMIELVAADGRHGRLL